MTRISIITAVHNGLAINKIFYHYLVKYTVYPFELIIIDNASTDGTVKEIQNLRFKVQNDNVKFKMTWRSCSCYHFSF